MPDVACMLPWRVSSFSGGTTSVVPLLATVKSVAELEQVFRHPKTLPTTQEKARLPCWSPALYAEGKTRANSNVEEVTALVYEMDHTPVGPQAMIARLKEHGCCFIVHTTWSHRPSEPRYRVILFLSRPLTPQEFPIAWSNGLQIIGYDSAADRNSRNISRHFILPAQCQGVEYLSEIYLEGTLVCTDKLSQEKAGPAEGKGKGERDGGIPMYVFPDTIVELDLGRKISLEELVALGEGKYKCRCPFQEDASEGSAFFRVMKNGRGFLLCTSERHTHPKKQYWMKDPNAPKKSKGQRDVGERKKLIGQVPDRLREYAETNVVYHAYHAAFYRYDQGAWQISNPIRKEALVDHLVGLLPEGCDRRHALALVDHVLSRQVYGMDYQYSRDRIVYQNDQARMNLYAWPTLTPAKGDWPRIKQILQVLTNQDSGALKWLVHWSASLIQNPHRRSMVAVLVLSPQQGIGKSMYGRLLAEIIGRGNMATVSNRALRDSFNSNFVTSLLVLADEVGMTKRDNDVIAELKSYITDDQVHCAAPYAQRTNIINRMTWWMTSNNRRPLLIEQDDRRFTIFSPAEVDQEYRMMLRDCFDPKTQKFASDFYAEVCGFAQALRQVEVDWHLLARPYASAAKKELQDISQGSLDAFLTLLREVGPAVVMSEFPPPPTFPRVSEAVMSRAVPCRTLYGTYKEWCEQSGRRDVQGEHILRNAITRFFKIKTKNAHLGGRRMEVFVGLPTPPNPDNTTRGQVVQMPG